MTEEQTLEALIAEVDFEADAASRIAEEYKSPHGRKVSARYKRISLELRRLLALDEAVGRVQLMSENPVGFPEAPAQYNHDEACAWADGHSSGVWDALLVLTKEEV